jgi:hypothetical protein
MASCADPAKQSKSSPAPQPAKKAQPAKAEQPAAKPVQPAPAAPKADQTPAAVPKPPAKAEQPGPSATPTAAKKDEPRSGAAAQPKAVEPKPQGQPPMSDTDRNSLAEQIRKQAETARQGQPAKPASAGPTRAAPADASKATPTNKAPVGKIAPTAGATAPKSEESPAAPAVQDAGHKGCGATSGSVDLTPPPADGPQPKFKSNGLKFEADAWVSKQAVFSVEVSNDGEAPLAIRLKGG